MSGGGSPLPRATVIILNWNGLRHLETSVPAALGQDYAAGRFDVLVADNASADGSLEWLEERHPAVSVVRFPENLGYARAMNAAVKAARGDVVAFLNNDARPEPSWLARLVEPIATGAADATASKMFSFDGTRVHFAGGGSNFHGIAFQRGMDEADGPEFSRGARSLFPCGAAMALRKSLFVEVGGFDEAFFAYYEDVDLGWRLNVLGHRVAFVPDSVVRHHHSATSGRVPIHRLRVFHVRNPLRMIYKNLGDEALARIFPAALLLTARRTAALAGIDRADFEVNAPIPGQGGERPGGAARGIWSRWRGAKTASPSALPPKRGPFEQMPYPKVAASDVLAVNDLLDDWDGLAAARAFVQSRRRVGDEDVLPLFLDPFRPAEPDPAYRALQDRLVDAFRIRALFPAR